MTLMDSNAMRKQPKPSAPDDLSEPVVKLARRVQALSAGAYTITLQVVGKTLSYSVHREGKIEHA